MAPLRVSTTKSEWLPDDPTAFVPTRLWKLPFITTWDDSRNQNRPTDSAEEAEILWTTLPNSVTFPEAVQATGAPRVNLAEDVRGSRFGSRSFRKHLTLLYQSGTMARITVIKVEKLFGYFNYKLALHTEEQLTIVHSPNGYGKTNLLRLINAFNKGDYSTLVSIPFRLLSIKFDDGQQVMLSRVRKAKVPTRRSKGPHQCFEVMSHSPGDQSGASRSGIVTGQFVPLNRTADEDSVPLRYPDLVIQEDGRWKLPETGEVFTTEQLTGGSPTQVWWQEPSWLRASRTSCPVIFIDTQRLYRAVSNTDGRPHNYRRPSALRVYSAARELARSIRKALDGFADLTVTLDGSFAQRFLSDADESMSEQDEFALRDSVRQHIDTVEKRRSELAALGLIDEQKEKLTVPLDRASLASLRFLSRYIVDLQVKLQVFDDLASRLTMLRDIIHSRPN